jgi:hypothetical protein
MYKKHNISCFLLFVCLVSVNSVFSEEKLLIMENYFPKGEERVTFVSVPDLEITEDSIYVVENYSGHRILVYTRDGKLKRIIGKEGKEPGELTLPIYMSIWNQEIAVMDNAVLSFFKTDGSYIRRFNPFVNDVSFVYIKDKIYIFTAVPDKESLIDFFTPEGEFISEFGEELFKLDFSLFKGMSPIHAAGHVYDGKLPSDGKYLYYINTKFGEALVFSLNGEKIAEYDVAGLFEDGEKVRRNNEQIWLKEGIDLKKTKGRIRIDNMFKDAYLCEDKIYFLTRKIIHLKERWKAEYKINVVDKKSFKLEDVYKIITDENERVIALAVEEENKVPVFYFSIMINDNPSIVAKFTREK